MADIFVSLRSGHERVSSGTRQERVRLLKQFSSEARREFLDWLHAQDPNADVSPTEDDDTIAPVLKITTRDDVVTKLFSREDRPNVVSTVSHPFDVRVPEPQLSDEE